jgi:hypothetical protein
MTNTGSGVAKSRITLVIPDIVVKPQIRLVYGRVREPRVILEDRRREQLVMPRQPDQIVVPRDDPQRISFVPMHRILVAQPAVIGIGIGDDIRSKHVVLNCGAHNPSLLNSF